MKFNIFTLFPEIFSSYLSFGILSRALEKKIFDINLINIRNFANNKRQDVDDYPFGGGAGMILRPDIIGNAINAQKLDLKKN